MGPHSFCFSMILHHECHYLQLLVDLGELYPTRTVSLPVCKLLGNSPFAFIRLLWVFVNSITPPRKIFQTLHYSSAISPKEKKVICPFGGLFLHLYKSLVSLIVLSAEAPHALDTIGISVAEWSLHYASFGTLLVRSHQTPMGARAIRVPLSVSPAPGDICLSFLGDALQMGCCLNPCREAAHCGLEICLICIMAPTAERKTFFRLRINGRAVFGQLANPLIRCPGVDRNAQSRVLGPSRAPGVRLTYEPSKPLLYFCPVGLDWHLTELQLNSPDRCPPEHFDDVPGGKITNPSAARTLRLTHVHNAIHTC